MQCQSCGHTPLKKVLSLGYMPPVNLMGIVGDVPKPETWLPAELFWCTVCELVQLGCVGDKEVVFPPSYPYTSGSTRILRENFADLRKQTEKFLKPNDLVVDIGSNDGTLLSNFTDKYRVLGIEPTDIADIANERGILTLHQFFNRHVGFDIKNLHGPANLVTACNVFAHIDDVNGIISAILELLAPDGVFVSESHYLLGLLQRVQYDTIYHEHLRYYSVEALRNLFKPHGLKIFNVEMIPTHGGSIRVYASRTRDENINVIEPTGSRMSNRLEQFARNVVEAKRALLARICDIKEESGGNVHRIYGIGAPSRGSVVVTYCGLDHNMIDCVCEIAGSRKIGRYMPGTSIPVVDESKLYRDQPEYALIFSWHIAEEIMHSLRNKGYNGRFIVPISPVVSNEKRAA